MPVLPYCKERACTVPDLPNGQYRLYEAVISKAILITINFDANDDGMITDQLITREATIKAGSEVPHDTLADYICEQGLFKPFMYDVDDGGDCENTDDNNEDNAVADDSLMQERSPMQGGWVGAKLAGVRWQEKGRREHNGDIVDHVVVLCYVMLLCY